MPAGLTSRMVVSSVSRSWLRRRAVSSSVTSTVTTENAPRCGPSSAGSTRVISQRRPLSWWRTA